MGIQKPKNNKEIVDPIEQKALQDAMNRFYENRKGNDVEQTINTSPVGHLPMNTPPETQVSKPLAEPQQVKMSGFQSPQDFEKSAYAQQANVDPNLTVGYEIVPFPSKGLYYPHKISEVTVEYMTSKDEDILSTSSLIENGTVLDILIKNKLKTPNINTDELLVGDRNAILLFLRASSYGQEYEVRVSDPRTGNAFSDKVDLTK